MFKKTAGFLDKSTPFGDKCQMLAQDPPLLAQLIQPIVEKELPEFPSAAVKV